MKFGFLVFAFLMFACACAPIQPVFSPVPATADTPTAAATFPTPTARASTAAQSALANFMQARIERDDPRVLGLLTDTLATEWNKSTAPVQPPLLQLSNPCWYRFEMLSFDQTGPTSALARIRVFEHYWSGDSGGAVPRSWVQNVSLVETTAGWRVNALGSLENEREEPNEPHGATTSACIVVRTTNP